MSFKKILVAYDGSDLSKKALDAALKMGESSDASIEIIYVYQYPSFVAFSSVPAEVQEGILKDYHDHAKSVIDEVDKLVADNPRVTTKLKQGSPATTLLEYAEKIGCDLIVMGSRGLSGIREFVLGSVSHHIVQHSPVPVLVVK